MEQTEKSLDLLRAENEELVRENKQLMTLNHNIAVELQKYKNACRGMTPTQCENLRQSLTDAMTAQTKAKAANKTLTAKNMMRKEAIDKVRKELHKIAVRVVELHNILEKSNVELGPTPTTTTPTVAVEQIAKPEDPWQNYLQDIVDMYRKTGRLMGISTLAASYQVRNLTKEQFFQFGLSAKELVTKEDADIVAEKLRNNSR